MFPEMHVVRCRSNFDIQRTVSLINRSGGRLVGRSVLGDVMFPDMHVIRCRSNFESYIVESIERPASISYATCGSLSLLLDIFMKENSFMHLKLKAMLT